MVTVGQLIEQKRREREESNAKLSNSFAVSGAKAQQQADQIAVKQESNRINPLAVIAKAGSAYVASGGNPVAAGLAAVSGVVNKDKDPLKSGIEGVGQGVAGKFLADPAKPDMIGQSLQNIGDVKNINKTAPLLNTLGVDNKITKPLEQIGEYNKKELKQQIDNAKSNYELSIADFTNKKDKAGLATLKETINNDTSLSLIDKNTLIKSILKADTDITKTTTTTTDTKKPSGSQNTDKPIILAYEVEALRADSLEVLSDINDRIDKDKSLSDAGKNEARKKIIAQEKKIQSNITKIKEQFKKEQSDNMIEDSELIPGAIDDYLKRVRAGETPSIKEYVIVKEPEKKKRWFSKKDKKPSVEDLRKKYNY